MSNTAGFLIALAILGHGIAGALPNLLSAPDSPAKERYWLAVVPSGDSGGFAYRMNARTGGTEWSFFGATSGYDGKSGIVSSPWHAVGRRVMSEELMQ